jgi:hypothetical protein
MPPQRKLTQEKLARFVEISHLFNTKKNNTEINVKLDRYTVYWWIHISECGCIHEYQKNITQMLRNTTIGCGQCVNDSTLIPCCESQSLLANKKIMKFFDYDKNEKSPRDIFNAMQSILCYCKCNNTCLGQIDCKHEWSAMICDLKRNDKEIKCPFCESVTIVPCCKSKSVAGNPLFMNKWNFEVNTHINPELLRCQSQTLVGWKCKNSCTENPECKHEWFTTVVCMYDCIKANPTMGCGFCSGNKLCCRLKSAAMNAVLVESFDYHHPENQGVDLEKLFPKSEQKVWWKCEQTCEGQMDCVHLWYSSLSERSRNGCKYCASKSKIPCCIGKSCANNDLKETMKDFDYEMNYPLTPRDFFQCSAAPVYWKCQLCGTKWKGLMMNKTNTKPIGCRKHQSSTSYGELECMRIFDKLGIEYYSQYSLPSLPQRLFDFYFEWNNRNYILEFDGQTHFSLRFDYTDQTFQQAQERDIEKTLVAVEENYFVIRIDYTCIRKIEHHLIFAINNMDPNDYFYFTKPWMYYYILERMDI